MPRYMKKQTIEEFKNSLKELFKKVEWDTQDFDGNENPIEESLMEIVLSSEEVVGLSKLTKDILDNEYNFENADFPTEKELASDEKIPEHLYHRKIECVGFQTLEGKTFYGGFLSSDYSEPMFVAIYLDNKGFLRAYVPKKGNGLNPISGLSFDYDYADDIEWDEVNKRFFSVGDAINKYARLKGFKDFEDMKQNKPDYIAELYDTELIKQEILKRFVLK